MKFIDVLCWGFFLAIHGPSELMVARREGNGLFAGDCRGGVEGGDVLAGTMETLKTSATWSVLFDRGTEML